MDIAGKKILFVITKSNWGGAQRYVYDLAKGFKEKGALVKVAYGGTGEADAGEGALAARLKNAGIETVFVESFMRDISFSREFPALFELIRIYKKERPDVVHLNSSKAGGIGAVAGRIAGVRTIVFTVHGLPYDEDRPWWWRAIVRIGTWVTFLFCHRVIVISQDNYDRVKDFPFCRDKIRLVKNGIGDIDFLPREEARKKLVPDADPATVWIGTISELTRNKGVRYLIDAAKLLKIRGNVFQICVIGTGDEHDRFAKEITGAGLSDSVHLAGFVPDAAQYLSAFDIFTLTSVKEGLPYVLLEAAQAGCAVVASRIPGVTDIVDEHTGTLVAPKNAVVIADALERLITHPDERQTFGTALKMDAAAKFSLDRMIDETAKAY